MPSLTDASNAEDPAARPADPPDLDRLRDQFAATLARLLNGERQLALALSGGGDSTALALLAASAREALGLDLIAATVDHGLRAEAAEEAESAAALCERLTIRHTTLPLEGPLARGNLQAEARRARYAVLRRWRAAEGVRVLALGHSRDDLAETFLLRMARGSGVDGLAAMAETAPEELTPSEEEPGASGPLRRIRPLLFCRRATLREICRAAGAPWAEDPSNADARFHRVRARAALDALTPLGLGVERLAKTAESLSRARLALEEGAAALLRRAASVDLTIGLIRLSAAPLREAPTELALRAVARCLEWVAGAQYPPRLESLEAALATIREGGRGRSLHGAILAPSGADGRDWTVCREPAAVDDPAPLLQGRAAWDGRFTATASAPLFLCAVGEGGRLEIERRRDGAAPSVWAAAPLAARRAAPALWDAEGRLVAAPAAGLGADLCVITPQRPAPVSVALE
ncbi:MAG: tRNA lysidine(34) synthetase TilS [Pseudomonadota bacterium]